MIENWYQRNWAYISKKMKVNAIEMNLKKGITTWNLANISSNVFNVFECSWKTSGFCCIFWYVINIRSDVKIYSIDLFSLCKFCMYTAFEISNSNISSRISWMDKIPEVNQIKSSCFTLNLPNIKTKLIFLHWNFHRVKQVYSDTQCERISFWWMSFRWN